MLTMNERIKSLAVEADFALYEDGNFRSDPGQWINEEIEKFAELIIRECVDTLGQQYVTISDDADPEDNKIWIGAIMNTTVDGCKRQILSNFGVEE
jgi:hypothetical protein